MERTRKIKVLVVDDSIMFRKVISTGLSSDPSLEVVASAGDPFEARDKILEFHPDVITCDVEMPRMNGIEFVRRLLPQYFVPVVMVSSLDNKVFEALEAGAVDFVAKADSQSPKAVEVFINELIKKTKIASTVKSVLPKPEWVAAKQAASKPRKPGNIIAIGASTGGTEAIYSILSCLPPTVPGIVVVQHIPPVFSRMFAERLNNQTPLKVKEAENGDLVEPGNVYVAPGDYHMRIKKLGDRYKIECFQGERVNGHCPSVDVLFESVAKEAGDRAVGILLTGMGYDGAKGLLSMRRSGAKTIGQDEESSVVYGMPKMAFDIGAVEDQVSLGCIPQALLDLL